MSDNGGKRGWTQEEAQSYLDEVEHLKKEKSKLAEMAEANEASNGLLGNEEEIQR